MSNRLVPAPKAGFEPLGRNSPVTEAWAPIYWKRALEGVSIGFWLADRHCNARGFAHGGVIVALADIAMGLTLALATQTAGETAGEAGRLVTVNLAVDYLGVGNQGEWLELSPRLLKRGRSLCFVDCLITADATLIARSSATFKAVHPRPSSDPSKPS
jgi:acyl-coenzyme A thioesterase PaaI-like protein